MRTGVRFSLFLAIAASPLCAPAQLTRPDFERALDLQQHDRGLIDHLPVSAEWIEGTPRFVYRETLRTTAGERENGSRFMLVDASTQARQPAFDQQRLADALTKESGEKVDPAHLPFTRFHFEDEQKTIAFNVRQSHFT